MAHIRNALPQKHMFAYGSKAPALFHVQSYMLAHEPNSCHSQFDSYHNHFGAHHNYHDIYHNSYDGFFSPH